MRLDYNVPYVKSSFYKKTKLLAIQDEFLESGKEIAVIKYDPLHEYANLQSMHATISKSVRRFHPNEIEVVQRKGFVYLIRKDTIE